MDISKKCCLFIILLLVSLQSYGKAQLISKNSAYNKKVAVYSDLRLSEKGNWLLARTLYGQNADTILVFDTKRSGKIYHKLVKLNMKQEFLGEELLLAQGMKMLEVVRLKDCKKEKYNGVLKADVLSGIGKYVILSDQHVLSLYNKNSEKLAEVINVEDYVTDGKTALTIITKRDLEYSLINFFDKTKAPVYTGKNKISAVPQFVVGKYAAFIETEGLNGAIRCILVNTKTSEVSVPFKDFADADFIKLTSIENGDYYLIESEKRNKPIKDFMEIKYGNDPYLRFQKKGLISNRYWVFSPKKGTLYQLPEESGFDYISINNARFFLALSTKEQYDYRFAQPVFDFYLYDHETKTSKKIGDAVRYIEASISGRYLAMRNEQTMEWTLADTSNMVIHHLGKDLMNPFFSSDESMLVFESDQGVKIYSPAEQKFKEPLLSAFKAVLKPTSPVNVFQKLGVTARYSGENINAGIIIKALDKNNNTTSYYRWNRKTLQTIILPTKKLINDIEVGTHSNGQVYTIEESFDKSPDIYYQAIGSGKKYCMICDGENLDLGVRQDIISYTDVLGKKLKGVLFYPQHFKQDQKYPMVVKIYMEQNASSKKYLTDVDGGDGFNIRKLVENGYFVYLPDIVMDERGSGLAALDCINSSLDALRSINVIDVNRIGLTGHSFGSYETNFIATHSKRFKAYISSAGVSNLTSHYFTANYNSGYNEYARVENGQYEMKIPLAQNKNLYWENNPIYYAENVNAPMLLWAGMKDNNVLPSQTLEFYTALVRNRKDVIAIFYANQGHILDTESIEMRDISQRTMEWWDYFLKDKKDVGWIDKQMRKDAW